MRHLPLEELPGNRSEADASPLVALERRVEKTPFRSGSPSIVVVSIKKRSSHV